MAEEYLNPGQTVSSSASQQAMSVHTPNSTPLQPSTPTQKFFPPNMPPPPYSLSSHRSSRYGSQSLGVNEAFSTLGSRKFGGNNGASTQSFFSQSCDPLKMLEDDMVPDNFYSNTTSESRDRVGKKGGKPANVTVLPMDAEDYLVPSPQSPDHGHCPATPSSSGVPVNNNNKMSANTYMDLISETGNQFIYPPGGTYFLPGRTDRQSILMP